MCLISLTTINAADDGVNNHWSSHRIEAAQEPDPFTNALYSPQGYLHAIKTGGVEEIAINNDFVMTVHTFKNGIAPGPRWLEFLKFNSEYQPLVREHTYRIIVWDKISKKMITFADVRTMGDDYEKKLINTGTFFKEYVKDKDLYALGTPPKKLAFLQALKKIMTAHDHIMDKMEQLAIQHKCSAVRIECSRPEADYYYHHEHHFKYVREKWEKDAFE